MDGTGRHVIVNESVLWPNGLSVDYAAGRLYWVDAKYHVIESVNLDGSQRSVLLHKGLCVCVCVSLTSLCLSVCPSVRPSVRILDYIVGNTCLSSLKK